MPLRSKSCAHRSRRPETAESVLKNMPECFESAMPQHCFRVIAYETSQHCSLVRKVKCQQLRDFIIPGALKISCSNVTDTSLKIPTHHHAAHARLFSTESALSTALISCDTREWPENTGCANRFQVSKSKGEPTWRRMLEERSYIEHVRMLNTRIALCVTLAKSVSGWLGNDLHPAHAPSLRMRRSFKPSFGFSVMTHMKHMRMLDVRIAFRRRIDPLEVHIFKDSGLPTACKTQKSIARTD